jgi:hypothetical protein
MPTPEQLLLMVCECHEMARVLGDSPMAAIWLELADNLAEIARTLGGNGAGPNSVH